MKIRLIERSVFAQTQGCEGTTKILPYVLDWVHDYLLHGVGKLSGLSANIN